MPVESTPTPQAISPPALAIVNTDTDTQKTGEREGDDDRTDGTAHDDRTDGTAHDDRTDDDLLRRNRLRQRRQR